MSKPVSVRDEQVYVLESDRDVPDHTTFRIRPLTLLQQNPIIDLTMAFLDKHGSPPVATLSYMTLKAGLVGFDNAVDSKGEQIELMRDRDGHVSDDTLARLPFNTRVELANAITDISNITGDDAKN